MYGTRSSLPRQQQPDPRIVFIGVALGQLQEPSDTETIPELFHCALKPRPIDLDPLTTQQHKVLSAGEQGRNLGLGEWLAIQHDAHLEIQQPVQPDSRRHPATDCRCYLRSGGTAGAPRDGHAHHHPGAFKLGDCGFRGKSPGIPG